MAPCFISLVLCALVARNLGPGFGRFGYSALPSAPDIQLDATGLQVGSYAEHRLEFLKPLMPRGTGTVSEVECRVRLQGGGRVPDSCRVSLLSPGIELSFQQGIGLRCRSASAPILTWAEGSAGPGIPTPAAAWVLVSWPDPAPPILLAFPKSACSLRVTGRAGDWLVENAGPFRGTVRVVPPVLDSPRPTAGAAALGRLSREIRPILPLLTAPVPTITGFEVRESGDSILGIWRFDRPGAIVPTAAVLAPAGGYPLRIESASKEIGLWSQATPTKVTVEPKLVVRFPAPALPPGRPLTPHWPHPSEPVSLSSNDARSVLHHALAILSPSRAVTALAQADGLTNDFLAAMPQIVEPLSGQALPYGPDGANMDLVAAHAVLVASAEASGSGRGGANALLLSVTVRRDWLTWLPWSANSPRSRRAGAFAAVAGLLSANPEERLAGAMYHAGLAAQRGLAAWRRTRKLPQDDLSAVAVLDSLRAALLGLRSDPGTMGFVQVLRSPARLLSTHAVRVHPVAGGMRLDWRFAPGESNVLEVAVPAGTRTGQTRNCALTERAVAPHGVVLRFRARSRGECSAELLLPPGTAPHIPSVAFPKLELSD